MLGPGGGSRVGRWRILRGKPCNIYQGDVDLLKGGYGRYDFDCGQRLNIPRICNWEDSEEIYDTVLDQICHLWRVWECRNMVWYPRNVVTICKQVDLDPRLEGGACLRHPENFCAQ